MNRTDESLISSMIKRIEELEKKNEELNDAIVGVPDIKMGIGPMMANLAEMYWFYGDIPKEKPIRKYKLHKLIDEIKDKFNEIEKDKADIKDVDAKLDDLKWRIVMLEEKLKENKNETV